MLGSFLTFFACFALFFYPHREEMHWHGLADTLASILPEGCKGFVCMIRYWSFTIFYAMAELWSNIVLSMLCWGFANQITRLDEAKRFYGLFGVGINISGIAAGQLSIFATQLSQNAASPGMAGDSWGPTMNYLISMVIGAGALALLGFAYLNRVMRKDASLLPTSDSVSANKAKKPRFSMRANIRYLFSSR